MATSNYIAKKKAIDNAAWMNQPPHPLPILRKGSKVNVYRGSGWSAAIVVNSTRDGCCVEFIQSGQRVKIYDARSLKPVTDQ